MKSSQIILYAGLGLIFYKLIEKAKKAIQDEKKRALNSHHSPSEDNKNDFGTCINAKPEIIIAEKSEHIRNYLSENKEKIRQIVEYKGAVLLRNFNYPEENKVNILQDLDYDIATNFCQTGKHRTWGFISLFGKVPSYPVGDRVFVSNKLERSKIIMPHTELAYCPHPPKVIAFRSHKNTVVGGSETPFWNTHQILNYFSESMLETLRKNYCQTTLIFSPLDFMKKFDVYTIEEGIKLANEMGNFDAIYLESSNQVKVWSQTNMIEFDGEKEYLRWNGDFWGQELIEKWLSLYDERYTYWEKWIHWLKFRLTNYYQDKWANSILVDKETGEFRNWTTEEINELHYAFSKSMYLMEWQENDVLIVNNKKIGHARSNIHPIGERQLHVMYAEV